MMSKTGAIEAYNNPSDPGRSLGATCSIYTTGERNLLAGMRRNSYKYYTYLKVFMFLYMEAISFIGRFL